MKIWCDACDIVEATVFCSADKAALCDGCDHRVHHANKLASIHLRFSLLHPSLKQTPLCDICQERRAFLFCQEDRAILCRECDIPIHKANEHTQKHNRFLLTGVKLSASSYLYPSPNSCDASTNRTTNIVNTSPQKKSSSVSNEIFFSPSVERAPPACDSSDNVHDNHISENGAVSTSRISEYLETLPGWRVDDLLDPVLVNHSFSSKTCDLFLPSDLVDHDHESAFTTEDFSFWVPQVSPHFPQRPLHLPETDLLYDYKEAKETNNVKVRRRGADGFAVPEISPPSLKKSRHQDSQESNMRIKVRKKPN